MGLSPLLFVLGREAFANQSVQRLLDILMCDISRGDAHSKGNEKFDSERDLEMQMSQPDFYALYHQVVKQIEGETDFSQFDTYGVGEQSRQGSAVKVEGGNEQSHGQPVPHAAAKGYRDKEGRAVGHDN